MKSPEIMSSEARGAELKCVPVLRCNDFCSYDGDTFTVLCLLVLWIFMNWKMKKDTAGRGSNAESAYNENKYHHLNSRQTSLLCSTYKEVETHVVYLRGWNSYKRCWGAFKISLIVYIFHIFMTFITLRDTSINEPIKKTINDVNRGHKNVLFFIFLFFLYLWRPQQLFVSCLNHAHSCCFEFLCFFVFSIFLF